jgi:hypothetical protein
MRGSSSVVNVRKPIASSGLAILLAIAPWVALAQTPPATPTAGQPTVAPGQKAVTVNVPEAGPKFARIIPSADAKQPAQLPQDFSDKKFVVTIDPATVGKSPKIAIDDAKTGNTAIKPVPDSYEITLLRPDFDRVHVVNVKVTYDGKPVQVARVTLAPFDKAAQTQVIDAARQGVAVFNDVAAGKGKLTIVYGDNFTQAQDIVVTTDHPGTSLDINAPVSNKVATLDSGAAAGTSATAPVQTAPPVGISPTAPTPAPDSGGGFAGFIGNILALGFVAGGIYLFWKWFQSGGFAATMKKVGIEVSGPTPPSDAGTPWQPNAPAAPVIADPSVCQFCGQKKDAGGNCACTLSPGSIPGAAVTAGVGPAVTTQARLVATMGVYSGSIFPLNVNGTGITLGRDTTNSIPLDNDTTVSRRHASIRHDGAAYTVVDEGSSNGVYVNGVRISGSQPLRPGDEVQIGNTRFRFEL